MILSKATSDTIWDWDMGTDSIQYNEGIADTFGYKFPQVHNTTNWWKKNIHPDDKLRIYEQLDIAFSGCQTVLNMEYRYQCANGSYKYVLDRAVIVYGEGGKPRRMLGAMQDITYQKEEGMRIDRAVINAQEEERKQIGMELHDNVNQLLSASLMYLSVVKDSQANAIIIQSKLHINEAISEIRRVSHQLAPASFNNTSMKDVLNHCLTA
ncbi:MAG: PAS domain-containing protein [Chitinophagaceae bacterium]|nr:PAS domain-containing protein [Chitinophagaceae bacterium]